MHHYDLECPECGACAFEVPDENGDTWCAMCGTMLNVDTGDYFSQDDDELPEGRTHSPQVAGRTERPIEVQVSDRLAGSSRRSREAFLTDDDGGW